MAQGGDGGAGQGEQAVRESAVSNCGAEKRFAGRNISVGVSADKPSHPPFIVTRVVDVREIEHPSTATGRVTQHGRGQTPGHVIGAEHPGAINDGIERHGHSVSVAAERALQNLRRVVECVLWNLRHS